MEALVTKILHSPQNLRANLDYFLETEAGKGFTTESLRQQVVAEILQRQGGEIGNITACLQILLGLGASINARLTDKGSRSLHLTSWDRNLFTTVLFTHGADHLLRDDDGNLPIHTMVQDGSLDCLKIVCRFHGTKDNFSRSCDGMTPLHLAVTAKHPVSVIISIIELLLREFPALLEVKETVEGSTALILAAKRTLGAAQIVECLLNFGAATFPKNNAEETALDIAVARSGLEDGVAQVLVAHQAGPLDTSTPAASLTKTIIEEILLGNVVRASRMLNSEGFDPSVTDENGNTFMHLVAARGTLTGPAIQMLQKAKANINAQNALGETPLALGVANFKTVSELMLAKADPLIPTHSGETALTRAAKKGAVHSVENLLSNPKVTQARPDDSGIAVAFLAAASDGFTTVVSIILRFFSRGIVSFVDKSNGNTGLHVACAQGMWDIVDLLLEHGASVSTRNRDGQNALDVAREAPSAIPPDTLTVLSAYLEAETIASQPPPEDGSAPALLDLRALLDVCAVGDFTAAVRLVQAGANLREVNHSENTILHLLSETEDCPMERLIAIYGYLVAMGADVDKQNLDGRTALHLSLNRSELLRKLLFLRADPNIADNNGMTPLHFAAGLGNVAAVQILLADTRIAATVADKVDSEGRTCLHSALVGSHDQCAVLIISAYNTAAAVPLALGENEGDTPLIMAVSMDNERMVRALLNAGASPLVRNKKGFDALAAALQAGRSFVPLLQDAASQQASAMVAASELAALAEDEDSKDREQREQDQFLSFEDKVHQSPSLTHQVRDTTDLYFDEPASWSLLAGVDIINAERQAKLDLAMSENEIKDLFDSAFRGEEQLIDMLRKNRSLCLVRGEEKKTLLHCAAQGGQAPLVRALLACGSLPNAQTLSGLTALHFAVMEGHLTIVKMLLEGGEASSDIVSDKGLSALHFAAGEGHLEICTYLVQTKKVPKDLGKTKDGLTPLHLAVMQGHVEVAKYLAKAEKIMVNRRTESGDTILHLAAATAASTALVNALLGCGARASLVNHSDRKASVIAREMGNVDIAVVLERAEDVEALKDRQRVSDAVRAISDKEEWFERILRSAELGEHDMVEQLLSHQYADIEASFIDKFKQMPLHAAALNGHLDIVRTLFAAGANLEAKNLDGCTALHVAAMAGQYQVVKLLLETGSKVTAVDDVEFTPLHYAASQQNVDVILALIEYSSDLCASTSLGKTPLLMAIELNMNVAVGILCRTDPLCIEMRTSNGTGPLLVAVSQSVAKRDRSAVGALLDAGARLDSRGSDGTSVRELCAQLGRDDYLEMMARLEDEIFGFKVKEELGPATQNLLASVWAGNVAYVEETLRMGGCDFNCGGPAGLAPIHVAAAIGRADVMQRLLTAGASVRIRSSLGHTAVHIASLFGNSIVLRMLFAVKSVEPNTPDYNGNTALLLACGEGNLTVAKILAQRGGRGMFQANSGGDTALHIAARQGHVAVCEWLCKHPNVVPHARNKDGDTALHIAQRIAGRSTSKKVSQIATAIALLILRGETAVSVCHRSSSLLNNSGLTPSEEESSTSTILMPDQVQRPSWRETVTEQMNRIIGMPTPTLESGEDENVIKHSKKVMQEVRATHAQRQTQEKQADAMLTTISSIADKEKAPGEALLTLYRWRDSLLENVPRKVNCLENEHATIIDMFRWCLEGDEQSLDAALIAGRNCNAKDAKGNTMLHYACANGQLAILQRLLRSSVRPNDTNNDGWTPLHTAALCGHGQVVADMCRAGGSVNGRLLSTGHTPLHFAAAGGHTECAKVLIGKYAADTLVKAENGLTPFETAYKLGNNEIAVFLALDDLDQVAAADDAKRVSLIKQHGVEPLPELLFEAAREGDMERVSLMLDLDDEMNAMEDNNEAEPGQAAFMQSGDEHPSKNDEAQFRQAPLIACTDENGDTALHHAARSGSTETIRTLLSHKADPNAKNFNSYTATHSAVEAGNVTVLRLLRNFGASMCISPPLLHIAVHADHLKVVKFFTSECPKESGLVALSQQDENGGTPVHVASILGRVECLEEMLKLAPFLCRGRTLSGEPPLHLAVRCTSERVKDVLTTLISYGASVDDVDGDGRIALEIALELKLWTLAQFLHNQKEDRYFHSGEIFKQLETAKLRWAYNNTEDTAPISASESAENEAKTAETNLPNVEQQLLAAAERGDEKEVENLLQGGVDSNFQDADGNTALHLSSKNGHTALAEVLLAYGASSNIFNAAGYLAVHLATLQSHVETVLMFIELNLPVATCVDNNNGDTPLHMCALRDEVVLAKLLVERGSALINATNFDGMTPLHCAVVNDSKAITAYLLNIGAPVLPDMYGNTPTHYAASLGQVPMLRELVKSSPASLLAVNCKAHTPLHFAVQYLQIGSVETLVKISETTVVAPDWHGDTPIHFAAGILNGHLLLRLLCVEGLEVATLKNFKNLAPLDIARKLNRFEAIEYFEEWEEKQKAVALHPEKPIRLTALMHSRNTSALRLQSYVRCLVSRRAVAEALQTKRQMEENARMKIFTDAATKVQRAFLSHSIKKEILRRRFFHGATSLLQVAVRGWLAKRTVYIRRIAGQQLKLYNSATRIQRVWLSSSAIRTSRKEMEEMRKMRKLMDRSKAGRMEQASKIIQRFCFTHYERKKWWRNHFKKIEKREQLAASLIVATCKGKVIRNSDPLGEGEVALRPKNGRRRFGIRFVREKAAAFAKETILAGTLKWISRFRVQKALTFNAETKKALAIQLAWWAHQCRKSLASARAERKAQRRWAAAQTIQKRARGMNVRTSLREAQKRRALLLKRERSCKAIQAAVRMWMFGNQYLQTLEYEKQNWLARIGLRQGGHYEQHIEAERRKMMQRLALSLSQNEAAKTIQKLARGFIQRNRKPLSEMFVIARALKAEKEMESIRQKSLRNLGRVFRGRIVRRATALVEMLKGRNGARIVAAIRCGLSKRALRLEKTLKALRVIQPASRSHLARSIMNVSLQRKWQQQQFENAWKIQNAFRLHRINQHLAVLRVQAYARTSNNVALRYHFACVRRDTAKRAAIRRQKKILHSANLLARAWRCHTARAELWSRQEAVLMVKVGKLMTKAQARMKGYHTRCAWITRLIWPSFVRPIDLQPMQRGATEKNPGTEWIFEEEDESEMMAQWVQSPEFSDEEKLLTNILEMGLKTSTAVDPTVQIAIRKLIVFANRAASYFVRNGGARRAMRLLVDAQNLTDNASVKFTFDGKTELRVWTLDVMSRVNYQRGKFSSALTCLDSAQKFGGLRTVVDFKLTALLHAHRGCVLAQLDRTEDALKEMHASLKLLEDAGSFPGSQQQQLKQSRGLLHTAAIVNHNIASQYFKLGNLVQASKFSATAASLSAEFGVAHQPLARFFEWAHGSAVFSNTMRKRSMRIRQAIEAASMVATGVESPPRNQSVVARDVNAPPSRAASLRNSQSGSASRIGHSPSPSRRSGTPQSVDRPFGPSAPAEDIEIPDTIWWPHASHPNTFTSALGFSEGKCRSAIDAVEEWIVTVQPMARQVPQEISDLAESAIEYAFWACRRLIFAGDMANSTNLLRRCEKLTDPFHFRHARQITPLSRFCLALTNAYFLFEKRRFPDALSFLSAAKQHLAQFEVDNRVAVAAAARAQLGSIWRYPGALLSAMLHNCKGAVHSAVGSYEASVDAFVTSAEVLSMMDPSEAEFSLPEDLEIAWVDHMSVTLHNLAVTHMHLGDEPAAVHAIMRAVDVARHKGTVCEIPELVERMNETLRVATLALDRTLAESGTMIYDDAQPRIAPLTAVQPVQISSPKEKKLFARPQTILEKLAQANKAAPKKVKKHKGTGGSESDQSRPTEFKVLPGKQGPRSPPSSSESSRDASPVRTRPQTLSGSGMGLESEMGRFDFPARRAQSALDSTTHGEWESNNLDFTWETLALQASSPRVGLNKLRGALLGELKPLKRKKQSYQRALSSPFVPYEHLAATAWSGPKKPQRIPVVTATTKRSKTLPALDRHRMYAPPERNKFLAAPPTVAEQAINYSDDLIKSDEPSSFHLGHRGPSGFNASPYARGKAAANRALGLSKLDANSKFTKSILEYETDFSRSKSLKEQYVRSHSPPPPRKVLSSDEEEESEEGDWEVDDEEVEAPRGANGELPRALQYLKQFCWTDQGQPQGQGDKTKGRKI